MNALLEAIQLHSPPGPLAWVVLSALVLVPATLVARGSGLALATSLAAVSAAGFVFVGNIAIPLALAAVALMTAVTGPGRRAADLSWRVLGHEIAWVGGGYIAYEFARVHTEGSFSVALQNSLDLIRIEESLGLYWEPTVQGWFLDSEPILRVITAIYSFWYLPFVLGVLFWLLIHDRRAYRVYVIGLGVSALLAVLLIMLLPVAPPRMVPESDLVDIKALLGGRHHYANELAAVPSLHVGWVALGGFALWYSIRGRLAAAIAPLPALVMLGAVIITGNHYWLDAAIGVAISIVPAAVFIAARGRHVRQGALGAWRATTDTLRRDPGAQTSTLFLVGLLVYLVAGQVIAPGFTDYWGYLVFQMVVTLMLLLAGNVLLRDQGGLSAWTHLIAVATAYADTFGTAGDLYARIDEYDKLTHFFGIAAITAGTYDCLKGAHRWGMESLRPAERLLAAVTLGMVVSVGWECYEFIGDRVFNSSRIGGVWDTTNDLISDAAGATTAGLLLWWAERRARSDEPLRDLAHPLPAEGPGSSDEGPQLPR